MHGQTRDAFLANCIAGIRFAAKGCAFRKGEGSCVRASGFSSGLSWRSQCPGVSGGVSYPVECETDYPLKYYIFQKDDWGPIGNFVDLNPSGNPLTKADFLKDWGEPDEIVPVSSNRELWVYNRTRFCGITPVYIVPVPLGLPICDEFDHITFENDRAVHIHFRRVNDAGMLWCVLGAGDMSGPARCPAEHNPSEKEIWMLPSDPTIISIPHTESCQLVAFKDGAVWWTDGYVDTRIDPVSLKTLESASTADQKPSVFDHAVGFGARWQAAGSGKKPSLTRTELETGKIAAIIPLDRAAVLVVTGEDAVWVLQEKLLSRVDPQSNKVAATIPVDLSLLNLTGKMAVANNAVWIASGSTLIRVDPLTTRIVGTFQIVLDKELPANYYSILDMAAKEDTLWILASKRSQKFFDASYNRVGLVGFDTRTNTLLSTQFLGSGDSWSVASGSTIAATEDAVWA